MDLQNSKVDNFLKPVQNAGQNTAKTPVNMEAESAFDIQITPQPTQEGNFSEEALAILNQIDGGNGEYVSAGSFNGTIGEGQPQSATSSNAQPAAQAQTQTETQAQTQAQAQTAQPQNSQPSGFVRNLLHSAAQNILAKTANTAAKAAGVLQNNKLQTEPVQRLTAKSIAPQEETEIQQGIAETQEQKEKTEEAFNLAQQIVGQFISITVEKWIKGGTGNNCLENIIKNNYDLAKLGIKLYDEKYNNLEKAVMDSNPEIYGDNDGNGSREKIIDGTRHNATLYPGDVIKLPQYEEAKPIAPVEDKEIDGPEEEKEPQAVTEKKDRYDSREELAQATSELRKTDLGKYLDSIDEDKYYYTNYDKTSGEYKVTTYIKDKDTDAIRQILFDETGKELDIFEMRKDGSLLTKEEVEALEK